MEFRILCGGQCHPITILRRLSPYGGGGALGENVGSVCRQDSQTLSLEYTFMVKNKPLNIQVLLKITRPYTVYGVNIAFICDPSARNESHVGSIQVAKMGNSKFCFFVQILMF